MPRRDDPSLASALAAAGALVDEVDFIQRLPLESPELDRAAEVAHRGGFAWLAITSAFTVFALERTGHPLASLIGAGSRVAAVGRATAAAVRNAGVGVDLIPATGEGGTALAAVWPEGSGRVLIPGAAQSAPTLEQGLRERGWDVLTVAAYRTTQATHLPAAVARRAAAGEYNALVVTAGSVARTAAGLLGTSLPVVAIGEPSAAAARQAGFTRVRVAASASAADVVAAIVSQVG